jgi:hypothetical protein
MSALGPAQRGPFPVDGLEFGLFAGEKLDEIPMVMKTSERYTSGRAIRLSAMSKAI